MKKIYQSKSLVVEETDTSYYITQKGKFDAVDIVIISKKIFELKLREQEDK